METCYLDNAATSYPKAPGVGDAMKYYIDRVGANINRSVYGAACEAGLQTLTLRERLKRFFAFPEKANHVILTPGNTYALNTVIRGFLKPGDRVLVSSMEHNAVMRPLNAIEGLIVDRVPCDGEGRLDPGAIRPLIKSDTKLCVMAHASNVSGTVQDAEAVGKILAEYGIPFVLDAAQTAGHIPVDFEKLHLSALCAPGHKGLLGPQGIGALLLSDAFAGSLSPVITGGTGSAGHTELQPPFLPDRFESGTANIPGIYGLEAAMAFLEETGVDTLAAHERALTAHFLDGLRDIPGVRLAGPASADGRVGVISLDFSPADNALIAEKLEREYGILTRCGMHCAPAAHKTMGTFPQGTVRFSPGYANTPEDVDRALEAIAACVKAI